MNETLSAVGGAQPDVDRNIRTVVKMLLAAHDEKPPELALKLRWSRSVMYSRLGGDTAFTAAEVAALADHFKVPVTVLFGGPSALLAGREGITPRNIPALATIADEIGQAA
jgi:hypothetical protein